MVIVLFYVKNQIKNQKGVVKMAASNVVPLREKDNLHNNKDTKTLFNPEEH